ncbi:C-type lectin 37Db-like [Drosophila subpulchrella]|uniref:C-type lectin 37Db-like n=1 Tax=Drosophila subpulchrella TaxID=1486046 RepID=UPI0018A18ACB|nr:C-type lectin 37Db-like [Drosophila subpulchrella]
MFKIVIFLFCTLFASQLRGSTSTDCNVEDLVSQCGGFCFRALWPILDHISYHQESGSNASDINHIATRVQLDKIEKQLVAQQQVLSSLESSQMNIPKSFEQIGSSFYYIEKYSQQNWFAARDICRRMGGNLASIRSDAELTALNAKLPSSTEFWLDINDLGKTGAYVSLTSGKQSTLLKWSSGEPNNTSHHCVLLNNLMYDANCDQSTLFICQAGDIKE